MKSQITPLLLAAASAFLTHQAAATDYTWGGGTLTWTDTSPSGWNGGPPAAWVGDTATINSGTVTTTAENNENGVGIILGGTGVLNAAGGYFAEYTGLSFVNGGTLTAGAGDAAWGAGALGSFSVSGSSAAGSVINGSYFNLWDGSTFNVANVTGNADADLTISAQLNRIAFQTSASLTKTGAGTLSLAANNVLNNIASVTIAGGTISQTGAGWNQLNNLTLLGGTLESTLTGQSTFGCYWLPGTVTVSGSSASAFTTVGSGVQFINLGDLGSSTGSTTFNVADATSSSAADLIVSTKLGNEPFGGAAGLIKTGAGTMTLTAANSYTGGTAVNAGTLQFASGSLDSTAYVGLVNSTLQWAAGNTDGLNKIYIFNGTTGTLDTNGNNVTLSAIQDNGYNHTGSLVKAGSGVLTFTGTNLYTGSTTVNAGKLVVNGSTATGAVTVASGATLGGSGTVGGATTIQSGGHLAVGNSPGTQTFSSTLTFEPGSIFDWDLNADTADTGTGNQGTYDKVIANGTVSGTSVFTVALGSNAFTNAFWDTNKSWSDLFTGSGSFNLASIFTTFGGSGVATDGMVAGQGQFTFTTNTLNWTAVPEPTSALAGLIITAGLLRRRRD